MLDTGSGAKNTFRLVEQFYIANIHTQAFGCFGLRIIGNVNQYLPDPLVVSILQNLDNNAQ